MPALDRRSAIVAAAGAVVIFGVCGLMLDRFYRDAAFLKPHDFLQYWAAGRLNATGGNPYDADQLVDLQRTAVRDEERPTFMWNPPWALALVMPFGLLPMRTGQLCWLFAQLAAVVWAADALWRIYGGASKLRPVVCGAAILFYPVMHVVFLGQCGGWLLLGLAGFLVAATRGPPVWAMFTALCAVKPHLFLPFWVCLALNATRNRDGRKLLGWGVFAGVAAIVIVCAVNPDVWRQYLAAVTRPETDAHRPLGGWQHPLVGYRLRLLIDPSAFWLQMLPAVVAVVGTVVYWWVRRDRWDWREELPRLLPVGLIAAPYGAWEHDQLVLLIPVLAAAARLVTHGTAGQKAAAFALLLAVNAVALTIRISAEFIWVPPALFAWYAGVMAAVRPGAAAAPAHPHPEVVR